MTTPQSHWIYPCVVAFVLAFLLTGCSESTGPEGQARFLTVDAWACPDVNPATLTVNRCVREGDAFDPAVENIANRVSIMIIVVRPRNTDRDNRIVSRLITEGETVDSRVFGVMKTFRSRREMLIDTIAVIPVPVATFDFVLELAEGDTLPFLNLVADTAFHWD